MSPRSISGWFLAAQADPSAPEAEFFTFRRHPDDYLSWLGHDSLVKLNYQSAELRRRMYEGPDSVFRRWLRPPYSADGWRVDVGNMLGRQGAIQMNGEIDRGIRCAVKKTRADAYLMGENFFDASAQLQGDQWDAVMNYMGLAKPRLFWLRIASPRTRCVTRYGLTCGTEALVLHAVRRQRILGQADALLGSAFGKHRCLNL